MAARSKKLRYLPAFLCVVGIALGSAYVGARFGYKLARKRMQQNANPEAWHVHAMRVLEERLVLEDEQRDAIKHHLSEAVARLKETRNRTMSESDAVVEDLFAAVDAELKPQQQVDFRELIRDRRKVKRDIFKETAPGNPLRKPNSNAVAKPGK
ncbi:MAG: hypothetical protein CMO80_00735 [Verrucomicrobiales bacterium]|nr:hypothetical protein [Verrucomicrobiales bacterium]|tara:strand:- start:14811 stop:15272 length:462 start_codon:yes stop_codon:yes gene_type:complete